MGVAADIEDGLVLPSVGVTVLESPIVELSIECRDFTCLRKFDVHPNLRKQLSVALPLQFL